ncbi:pksn polyketide synthase for alternapyrone biosynthesis [Colletotrichum kahawae]|uniref:Pksn polyketide synthase for alternapyrone biosynthesis n=1 Tax=Colletotrichum kahawae TaxID=34407 RepID=A0AAD9Y565_COLKA|nr:pksn polyketide synthase for alternapyrone biosynthesis [Colletotrichum kahawae]
MIGSDSDSGLGTDSSAGRSPLPENTLAPWSTGIIQDEPVAVIGMACRFAKVESPSKLWDLVRSGRTGRTRIPERSWNAEAWYHPSRQRTAQICTTSGHFLDNVSSFDAPFFSISANEAASMDPMQRLGLEIGYEAFENAGIPMEKLAQSTTGVYSGVMTNDYQMLAEGDPYSLGANSAAGTGRSMLSNRISWFFDLRGPSLTIDTACSSTLYALHLACQSIRTGESHQALVTGHNLILNPTFFSQLSAMHMVSPDGISHSFDSSANGYGRGEGMAGVVVKRLSTAIADGDVIRAVIRATGVNSDGKTPGITVPSEEAQADLIREVYERSGLSMAQTSYFEAHGTGTPKGDPIEIRAISSTIGAARQASGMGRLDVGSVKPNIGHTEGCAGLAGLIKTVLCLEAGLIPPIAGLQQINHEIASENHFINFPMETKPWPGSGLRRASVNSFGFGGANAHLVLDDARSYLNDTRIRGRHITKKAGYRPQDSRDQSIDASENRRQLLFAISSFDRQGLRRTAQSLGGFLSEQKPVQFESLAHTLNTRRTSHLFRSFVIAKSQEELVSKLLSANKEKAQPLEIRSSRSRRLVFLFTGQGAQRPGMAKELVRDCPVFKDSIATSQTYLSNLGCGWELVDLLFNGDAETISDPEFSQPMCTAVQIALVHVLWYWGVTASAVIGHSSGEMVAAYAAGAVSHEEAMRVAYYRGLLSTQVSRRLGRPGAMLAVGLSEKSCREFLQGQDFAHAVTIACINSPQGVTLSGDARSISRVEASLKEAGHFARLLRTGGVAYHSPDMQVVGEDFLTALGPLKLRHRPLSAAMFSSVTENLILDAAELKASYWYTNMTSPVRFSGALHNLLLHEGQDGLSPSIHNTTVLEIGPSKTLAGPVGQIMAAAFNSKMTTSLSYLSILSAGEDSRDTSLAAAGMLWAMGQAVDLDKANNLSSCSNKLQLNELPILPSYSWNHSRSYWHKASPNSTALAALPTPRADLLGVPTTPQNPFEPSWQNVLRQDELPWLEDHAVLGAVLFPAAGYLVIAMEALRTLACKKNYPLYGIELLDVQFETGLTMEDHESASESTNRGQGIRLTLKPDAVNEWEYDFTIYATSSSPEEWRRLVRGTVVGVGDTNVPLQREDDFETSSRDAEWRKIKLPQLLEVQKSSSDVLDPARFYANLSTIGLRYGPTFQGLNTIRCTPTTADGRAGRAGKAYGELLVPDTRSTMPGAYECEYLIHPATLDGIFQLVFAAFQATRVGGMKNAAVPVSLRRAFIASSMPTSVQSKLVGVADAKYEGDAKESESSQAAPRDIIGSLIFSDVTFAKPAVIIDGIVLRELPVASGYEPVMDNKSDARGNKIERTAQFFWKEDIDQDFNLWKDLILSKTTRLDRCIFFLDRFYHKRPNPNAVFIGSAELRQRLLQSSNRCTLATSLEEWSAVIGLSSPSSLEKPTTEKFDLILLDEDMLAEEDLQNDPQRSSSWFLRTLSEGCAAGAWLVLIGGDKKPYLSVSQIMLSVGNLSNIKGIRISEASVDVYRFPDEPISIRPRITPMQEQTLEADDVKEGFRYTDVVILEQDCCRKAMTAPWTDRSDITTPLFNRLASTGFRISRATLRQAIAFRDQFKDKIIISLLELGQPFVYDWGEQDFADFRHLVDSASHILWLTTGDLLCPYSERSLLYSPTVGLLRVLRAEYPQLVLVHLDVTEATCSDRPESIVEVISETLRLSGMGDETSHSLETYYKTYESEYIENSGCLLIPRIMAHTEADNHVLLETSSQDGSPLLPIFRGSFNDLESVQLRSPHLWSQTFAGSRLGYWVLPERATENTEENSLWSGLQERSSALIRQSQFILKSGTCTKRQMENGFEVPMAFHTLGVVTSLSAVHSSRTDYRTGDWVLNITPQPIQPGAIHDVRKLIKLPSVVAKTPSAAAYWLGPISTAFHVLSVIGRVSEGDYVVIDVGENQTLERAFAIVAQRLRATKVLVVGRGTLIEQVGPGAYSDGPEDAIISRISCLNRATIRYVQSLTYGVKAVVSTTSTKATLDMLIRILSSDGCVIQLSQTKQEDCPGNQGPKSSQIYRFDLQSWDHSASDEFRMAIARVLAWAETGALTLPDALRQASTTDANDIAMIFESTTHGIEKEDMRIAVSLGQSDEVIMHRKTLASPSGKDDITPMLDSNATYIISGGLGSLGLHMASMLYDLGARHLMLLSRSGKAKSSGTLTALMDLEKKGCNVDVVACDITSVEDMKRLGAKFSEDSTPPLKGIIQSAMVLADSTFANMTFEKWQKATAPKIHGSWNLHNLQHFISEGGSASEKNVEDLDFFILLSSVSGVIGNSAQANYCAGNTFEDVLAHHRHANGMAAVSLNIGLVSDSSHFGSGTMSSFKNIDEYLRVFGHLAPVVVSTAEVLASVKMAIAASKKQTHPSTSCPFQLPPQLIVGISSRIKRSRELLNYWSLDRKFDHRTVWADDTGCEGDAVLKTSSPRANEALALAKDLSAGRLVVEDLLKAKLAQAMTLDVEGVDEAKSLGVYGSKFHLRRQLSLLVIFYTADNYHSRLAEGNGDTELDQPGIPC